MRCACPCEERSDEAIQEFKDSDIPGLLRFARNGGILHIYSMFLLNETAPFSIGEYISFPAMCGKASGQNNILMFWRQYFRIKIARSLQQPGILELSIIWMKF